MFQGKKELWIQTALPRSLLSKSILMVVFGSSYHDSDRNFSHPKSCGWFTTCFLFSLPSFPIFSFSLILPRSLSLSYSFFLSLSYFLKVSVLPHFHHPKTREWWLNGREIVSSRERGKRILGGWNKNPNPGRGKESERREQIILKVSMVLFTLVTLLFLNNPFITQLSSWFFVYRVLLSLSPLPFFLLPLPIFLLFLPKEIKIKVLFSFHSQFIAEYEKSSSHSSNINDDPLKVKKE